MFWFGHTSGRPVGRPVPSAKLAVIKDIRLVRSVGCAFFSNWNLKSIGFCIGNWKSAIGMWDCRPNSFRFEWCIRAYGTLTEYSISIHVHVVMWKCHWTAIKLNASCTTRANTGLLGVCAAAAVPPVCGGKRVVKTDTRACTQFAEFTTDRMGLQIIRRHTIERSHKARSSPLLTQLQVSPSNKPRATRVWRGRCFGVIMGLGLGLAAAAAAGG